MGSTAKGTKGKSAESKGKTHKSLTGLYVNSRPGCGESSKRNGRSSIERHTKRGEMLEKDGADNSGLCADSGMGNSRVGA